MTLRRWLVGLYPRAWRERYGEEFEALLEASLHSPLDIVDVVLGAVDAHLGFPFEAEWKAMEIVNRQRTAILIVFAAYVGFIVAGLAFYGLVDDSPAVPLLRTDPPLAAAWRTVQVGSVLGLLAILIGGLPLALSVLRHAARTRRGLPLLLVPAVALLALLAYVGLLALVASGSVHLPGVAPRVSPDDFPLGNRLLLGGLLLLFVLGAAASIAAVWRLVTRHDSSLDRFTLLGRSASVRPYDVAFRLAALATACMVLMVLGTLAFGWLSSTALPDWYAGNYGLLLTGTALTFKAALGLMIVCAAAAIVGMARAFPRAAVAA
ncbi:MAG TPA: hypothetical protein VK449_12925 [Anaerolineales bacterium]|nr:hypothetical protein [Anaerolineales bacterium]